MRNYTVNVGNIGNIEARDLTEAHAIFNAYKDNSIQGYGRASGESVVLFAPSGDILKEHVGQLPIDH